MSPGGRAAGGGTTAATATRPARRDEDGVHGGGGRKLEMSQEGKEVGGAFSQTISCSAQLYRYPTDTDTVPIRI